MLTVMSHLRLFLACLFLATAAMGETAAPVPVCPPQVRRSGGAAAGDGLDYLVYHPAGYDRETARRWPLVVFLHGMGERGGDLDRVRGVGLPRQVERRGNLAYVLVVPHCPDGTLWPTKLLGKMLDQVLEEQRVDPRRVVLTGLSMGGMGTWRWGIDQPDRFSALVPVCGGISPSGVGALKGMPIWAFHGDADPVVPIDGHRRIVDAARDAGALIRFTVYPGVGHNCWDRAYADPSLEEWMLMQRRR